MNTLLKIYFTGMYLSPYILVIIILCILSFDLVWKTHSKKIFHKYITNKVYHNLKTHQDKTIAENYLIYKEQKIKEKYNA